MHGLFYATPPIREYFFDTRQQINHLFFILHPHIDFSESEKASWLRILHLSLDLCGL
jgi:hypothetical protein